MESWRRSMVNIQNQIAQFPPPTRKGADMELRITFQCNQDKHCIPCENVLEENPWFVTQYVVANKVN